MRDRFTLYFDTMPKATAQMRKFNGKTHTCYKSKTLETTEKLYQVQLLPHKPEKPAEGAIRLFIYLYFDKKRPKKLWGKYKTTRPDVDNFCKALIDQMTKCGYWLDDAQIVDLHIIKYYAEKASIVVDWQEVSE